MLRLLSQQTGLAPEERENRMLHGKKATLDKSNTTSVTSQVPTAGITHPGASASINSPFNLFFSFLFFFFFLKEMGKTNKTTTKRNALGSSLSPALPDPPANSGAQLGETAF